VPLLFSIYAAFGEAPKPALIYTPSDSLSSLETLGRSRGHLVFDLIVFLSLLMAAKVGLPWMA
jgi:hypothetical protein